MSLLNLDTILSKLTEGVESFIPKLLGAIVFYTIGSFLIGWIYRISKRILEKKEFDPSLESFFLSFIKLGYLWYR